MRALKTVARIIARKLGCSIINRNGMPVGIDWTWDIERANYGEAISTIFDIGANTGQTVAILRKAFPSAAIHSFEPVEKTFTTLRRNTRNYPNFWCHQMAVGRSPGRGTMLCTDYSQTNHLTKEDSKAHNSSTYTETVNVTSLDSFSLANHIARIDILKVDVEGGEADVIAGAERLLREHRIRFLLTEVGFHLGDTGHSYAPTVINLLLNYNMRLHAIYDFHQERGRGAIFANALFVQAAH